MIDHFTDEQLATRELRDAAYHEAGHKTLYEHFGGAGDAVVWRNERGNPDERTWLGQFRPRMCPEAIRNAASASGFAAAVLPGNWKILVGVAGLLAEEILNAETDDVSAMADNMFFRIYNSEASDSDLAQMGVVHIDNCEFCYEVVEEAVRLLRQDWVLVQKEAEYLIDAAAKCSRLSVTQSRARLNLHAFI